MDTYPELSGVSPRQLSNSMQDLVRRGRMNVEVEWGVSQLYQLLEMSESGSGAAEQTQGYEFLILAEGAIHAILRNATAQAGSSHDEAYIGSDSTPIRPSWRGAYNDAYAIEMHIETWGADEFTGRMAYPDSDTVTRVVGRIETKNKDTPSGTVTWKETEFIRRGREIDFDGRYQATVSGDTMRGAWYHGGRLVAEFKMEATRADTVPALST